MREWIRIGAAVWHARRIQDLLWGKPGTASEGRNSNQTYEEWITKMGYRLERLRKVYPGNPSWKVEARKRALQIAAVSIAFICEVDSGRVRPKDNE